MGILETIVVAFFVSCIADNVQKGKPSAFTPPTPRIKTDEDYVNDYKREKGLL